MDNQFKPGDRVAIKSGGPGMTIMDIGANTGLVWCRWMDDKGVAEESFPPATLTFDPRSHFNQP